MKTIKITVGNSTIGYDSADCTKSENGKLRVIEGTIAGRKSVVRRAVANLNRGVPEYVTSAGDCLPITLC